MKKKFYFKHLALLFVIECISFALRASFVYSVNIVQNITSVNPIKSKACEKFKVDFRFIQLNKKLALVIHWLSHVFS